MAALGLSPSSSSFQKAPRRTQRVACDRLFSLARAIHVVTERLPPFVERALMAASLALLEKILKSLPRSTQGTGHLVRCGPDRAKYVSSQTGW